MTLGDHYKQKDDAWKKSFIRKVMDKTGKNQTTVYRWINGQNKPSQLEQSLIANLCNKPVSELFPIKATA